MSVTLPLRITAHRSFTAAPPNGFRLRSHSCSLVMMPRMTSLFSARESLHPGENSVVRQENTLFTNIYRKSASSVAPNLRQSCCARISASRQTSNFLS